MLLTQRLGKAFLPLLSPCLPIEVLHTASLSEVASVIQWQTHYHVFFNMDGKNPVGETFLTKKLDVHFQI